MNSAEGGRHHAAQESVRPKLAPTPPGTAGGGGGAAPDRHAGVQKASLAGSSQDVMGAIKKYEVNAGVGYAEVPPELCDARALDLHVWSLIATDGTLRSAARHALARVEHAARAHAATVTAGRVLDAEQMATTLAASRAYSHGVEGLHELNVHGADKVTDTGLQAIAEAAPALVALDLSSAYRVTDVGLRAIALRCTSLRALKLAGCLGVTGAGLSVVGESCPGLTELDLSACRHAANWALGALFNGCPRLTKLDLSHCPKLTDDDVRVLGDSCHELRWLSLAECKQLSDEGVLEVAKNCPTLETLNLTRSELPFKLTDVALLSVAEMCAMVVSIELGGCEMITDVGLSWVGRGCPALETLVLRDCAKVSNAGVRAVSDGCHHLRAIDLKNCKRVTDVGVRQLGQGCARLAKLDASGLFLLTDGMKREFGFEGLQALSGCCPEMKDLHLNGCFQVSTLALKSIAKGFRDLRSLALGSCPNLTAEGLVSVTHACEGLTRLSLAHCGDCVTDECLKAIGRHSARLRILDLTDCDQITEKGVRALIPTHADRDDEPEQLALPPPGADGGGGRGATPQPPPTPGALSTASSGGGGGGRRASRRLWTKGCRELRTLDLTGCAGVGDNALLPFATSDFREPGLQHLHLAGCTGVTDTGVSWVVDGCHDIVTLSLKGTRVTSSTMKSVLDEFKFSEYRRNGAFFGMWPQPRWKDRMIITEYGQLYRAATRLQATWRAKAGREEALEVKREFYKNWVARKMQAVYRGKLARREAARRAAERARRRGAATTIASFGRLIIARNELQLLRHEAYMRRLDAAALRVQCLWRALVARREAALRRIKRDELLRLQQIQAVMLQKSWRGFLSRRVAKKARVARDELLKKQQGAAIKMQQLIRGRRARKRVERERARRAAEDAAELKAALMCQRHFRMHRCKDIVREARDRRAAMEAAAIRVQAAWRARDARLETAVKASLAAAQAEEDAAVKIQNMVRGAKARAEVKALQAAEAEQRRLEIAAAAVLQRVFRGHKARGRIRRLKEQRSELLVRMAGLETWAATHIAAAWRGKVDRDLARDRRVANKARWKEMFDEASQRPFYYNQVSGEIRWRRPQDLLQLMRRQVCSNCEYYDAQVECQMCAEFFCHGCWGQVHAGGRRRLHAFRALYDFYERRVDYGDGEFPSRWPTEVLQDEMNGWLLRLSNDREPEETKGAWQRYSDPDTGRDFYYNRISGDGTYEVPDAFAGTDARIEVGAAMAGLAKGDKNRGHRAGALAIAGPKGSGAADGAVGDGTLMALEEGKDKKALAARDDTRAKGGNPQHVHGEGEVSRDFIAWERHVDDSGREYYINRETGETTYQRPGGGGGAPGGAWTRHYDEQYQIDYYYNETTGESTYQQPAGFVG